jgi:hypothetical protein
MKLTRTYYHDRTEGKIILPDGSLLFSIERPEESANPCIPEGSYLFERDLTGKHRWWRVLDVDGRTNIEIHPANYAHQLLGCIAPCMNIVNGVGFNSVEACKKMMEFYGEIGVKYVLDIKSCGQ